VNRQKEAADKARAIVGTTLDAETRHILLDTLLCDVLEKLGYDHLVRVYQSTTRVYS